MKLSKEDAQSVIWDEHEDWAEVLGSREITETSRWSIHHTIVCKHKPTEKLYRFNYSVGATESQDECPFDNEDKVTPTKVVEKEVTIRVWEPE